MNTISSLVFISVMSFLLSRYGTTRECCSGKISINWKSTVAIAIFGAGLMYLKLKYFSH